MKNNFRILHIAFVALTATLIFPYCKKENGGELGTIAKADFVAVPGTNPNNITLVNKSASASIPSWRVGTSSALLRGDSALTSFDNKGTYNVTLYSASRGGIDSITKQIVIAQDDPTACQRNVKGFLAGCTSKKWKLNPSAGAYKVGDQGPGAGNWWSSPAGEAAARSCEFNDEYTFAYASETFVYDNKGDFYGDNYLGNNTGTCQPSSNYTPTQAPYGSGNFTYTFVEKAGVKGLGQLTVEGLGAHIGIQKARNGGEIPTPATSVTYDVLSTKKDVGFDLIELGVNIGGSGWWTFTLRSF
jgi:hypothetical protein